MEQFVLLWLDDKDLEYAGNIVKRIPSVSSTMDALKWALKQAAARLPGAASGAVVTQTMEVVTRTTKDSVPVPAGSPIFIPVDDAKNDLGTSYSATASIPIKRLRHLEHMVIVDSGTLERLVPDAKVRLELLGDKLG